MAPIRESNAERRRGRDECRDKLSKHIRKKIQSCPYNPANSTRPEARHRNKALRGSPQSSCKRPYCWRALPSKKNFYSEIFAKNLSAHSIGTYRLLCREVGKTFEAVPSSAQCQTLDSITSLSSTEPSFSAVIDQLREENKRLSQQVRESTGRADAESERKRLTEEENRQLRSNQQWLEDQIRDHAGCGGLFQKYCREMILRT
ncbi:hypothetical protein QBC46DRAFT_388518, partial [Diplogelasinospora grovesii]